VIDRAEVVSDPASIGAARALSHHLGRRAGGSTGTNLVACARIAAEMAARGEAGSIVSILCDSGERYASTLYNDRWLAEHAPTVKVHEARMAHFLATGSWPE
jgi:cysteine synthase A